MSIENKRRVPNFTPSEKAHLMQIIASNFASVLEDKKTDRASSFRKEEAWKSVEKAFNASSSSSIYRTALSLKKCYENRKKELRKTLADEKRAVTLTGGGPPPKVKKEDTDDILISILNKKTLVGLHNPFDNDAGPMSIEFPQQETDDDIVFEYVSGSVPGKSVPEPLPVSSTSSANLGENAELINSGPEPSSYETNAWKKYTPCQLQCPLSAPLASPQPELEKSMSNEARVDKKHSSRRRPATIVKPLTSSDIAKKYDLLMDKRLELINIQLQHTKTHNDLTIQKLQLELEILKVELAKKKKEEVAENT